MQKDRPGILLTEHQEQCQLVAWFRAQYPSMRLQLFAIPNGGLRDIRVARKLKAEGVVSGVADLFLMVARQGYHGLFIEMKPVKGGQQARSQKEFEEACNKAGYKYMLAKGFANAQAAIKDYLAHG